MINQTPSPPPAAQHLSQVLDLEQLDTNLFRSRVNQINSNNTLFGGQILGQGLKAAALTVDPSRVAHSLHGYFLLAGASDIPVIYDVELTRDGGSFSTRRVVARQRAKTIFHMELSFHRQEQGYEHEVGLDIDVPEPEKLLGIRELASTYADKLPKRALAYANQPSVIDFRPVSPEDFFFRKSASTRALYWIRSTSELPSELVTQQAALAYVSDYFLTTTVILKHTMSMFTGEVMMASLDHAMWFHRPCRTDEWVLVDAISPWAGGARGFTRAQMFDRERRLIASVAQEGLVRPIKKE